MAFECGLCDYRSSHKSELRKHIQAIHGKRKYRCNDCSKSSKSYKWKKDLADHVKIVHCEWNLRCEFCDYKAPLQKHLQRHNKAKHTSRKLLNLQRALQSVQFWFNETLLTNQTSYLNIIRITLRGPLTHHEKSRCLQVQQSVSNLTSHSSKCWYLM